MGGGAVFDLLGVSDPCAAAERNLALSHGPAPQLAVRLIYDSNIIHFIVEIIVE